MFVAQLDGFQCRREVVSVVLIFCWVEAPVEICRFEQVDLQLGLGTQRKTSKRLATDSPKPNATQRKLATTELFQNESNWLSLANDGRKPNAISVQTPQIATTCDIQRNTVEESWL